MRRSTLILMCKIGLRFSLKWRGTRGQMPAAKKGVH
jgi:hypothetical protein